MTYAQLAVIDQLLIGPVQVTPRRIETPYVVFQHGEQHKNTLIYSYPESVFNPKARSSHNLAAVITAQLALNYGLFCRRIIFDGLFGREDQQFIRSMMENTSREIFVNKLLKPNEFLVGPVRELPPEKRRRYTNADIEFIDTQGDDRSLAPDHWEVDPQRYCVLSSGGKDSLLSYGLLRELGVETHAIFGNESGRHWFTALNGYRHLERTDPNTTKVWMNSDRLFNWMLRHLPFVRPDFAGLRSDDYPVRLWTVAVFLFGVLPLMKKRRLGRLIIGDEYDSTQRSRYEGITHYNGLYDQSRQFDETLSRYFLKKGWDIHQFSLLRPLSELLILKTLVERYPRLQQEQISCHAAHEKEGRIFPCGRCEKCRRIVGMLTALGADPRRCGYSEEQIDTALKELATTQVKQLGSDAAHLYHLLREKGFLPAPEGAAKARPHPEIMSLRFDRERSHLDTTPSDLRRPLFQLLLKHAAGAVRRVQHHWEPFDLLNSNELEHPAPFEWNNGHPPAVPPTLPAFGKHDWGLLTWEEAEDRLAETDIALLPVGAIEQHGPHLPLDVDAFDANYLAHRVAQACSRPQPLVLPLVSYGVSYHHQDFKGTLSISNEAMAQFIYDIGMSAARNGIKKLVIINGHGDNAPTLNYAAQMINRDAGIFVCVDSGETSDVDIEKLAETPNDIHAGEIETSTTLAVRPELVQMDKAVDHTIRFSSHYLDFSAENSVPWYVRTRKISSTGVMGDATKADVDKGRKIWKIMIAHLVALVEELKEMSLDEIHQRRY